MRTEMKNRTTASLPFIAFLILLLMPLLLMVGCGSNNVNFNGGNTVSSDASALTPTNSPVPIPSPTQPATTFFRAYVFAPVTPPSITTSIKNWPSTAGLVALLSNVAPNGYTAVQGAHVFPENNPSHVITTDSAGMFKIDFKEESGLNSDGGLSVIIMPMDNFARFASIKADAYPMTTAPGTSSIYLHTNPGDITVGSVAQLYVKATMENGSVKIVDPSIITWCTDNSEVTSISPQGIVSGLKAGTANVPVNMGNMSCTENITVRENSAPTCTLTGIVTDGIGTVPGAVISIAGNDTVAITNSCGGYSLPGLPKGVDLPVTVSIQGKVRYASHITMGFNTLLNINIPDTVAVIEPMNASQYDGSAHSSSLYHNLKRRGRIASQ